MHIQVVRWIACLQLFFIFSDGFIYRYPLQFAKPNDDVYKLQSSKINDTKTDIYTIQILMSDTGGGHRASANALENALQLLYPSKFDIDIVDIYTNYGPFWPYNDYVRMYKILAEYSWMWNLFYRFGETDFDVKFNEFLLDKFCYEPFKKCIARPLESTKARADMVVSVHPLCQDIPLKILSELDDSSDDRSRLKSNNYGTRLTPFVTVVTDLGGAHKTWFNPAVDKVFVPSDVLHEKARSCGLSDSQIIQHGLPIRKGFWSSDSENRTYGSNKGSSTSQEKSTVQKKLGLDERPTVLVVGGGDGMCGIVDIASSLGKKLGQRSSDGETQQYQMVVICGNNQQAKQKLRSNEWPGVTVHVEGFVSNMDEYMRAATCIVTKAGPGTIAEASICGLPCMLFAYLPGQEEGNVKFVENSGFGEFSSSPDTIGEIVSSWLKSPDKIQSMQNAAADSARPNAILNIARDIAEIAFSTEKQEKSSDGEALVMVR